jgi:8-oxo-dGTP diphosphatase
MEKNPTMLFVVAVALTNEAGEILLQMRPEGRAMAGLWEFPGGKVETGESPESALVREVKEELGVDIDAANLTPFAFASAPLNDRHLLLMLYICKHWNGEPQALESPELRWVHPADMVNLLMPPADEPLLKALLERRKI